MAEIIYVPKDTCPVRLQTCTSGKPGSALHYKNFTFYHFRGPTSVFRIDLTMFFAG